MIVFVLKAHFEADMMTTRTDDPETEALLGAVGRGDDLALRILLTRYRDRLRRMVEIRMDRRLIRRIDPSDVVQLALADADSKLGDYLRDRPLPFYLWVRRLAWERLIQLHRHHRAARRAVGREEPRGLALPDASTLQLAERLVASGPSPSEAIGREERRQIVRLALERLPSQDREVLVLRYLEELSFTEVAATLGIGLSAVKMRHLRALERIRDVIGHGSGDRDS